MQFRVQGEHIKKEKKEKRERKKKKWVQRKIKNMSMCKNKIKWTSRFSKVY
jgi:hypothetical protein